jgi:predicted glycogen debranching enzyme
MTKTKEWLEVDGLGGFAMGTNTLVPTCRYHSLLTKAINQPTNRVALVNGVELFASFKGRDFPLSSLQYEGDIYHPGGHTNIISFACRPWPRWVFAIKEMGAELVFEILMVKGLSSVVLSWKQIKGDVSAFIKVRPFLTVRDFHALHFRNDVFCFDSSISDSLVSWTPYSGCPTINAFHNGTYSQDALWINGCYYKDDDDRGYDGFEDFASPGTFHFDLAREEAYLIFSASEDQGKATLENKSVKEVVLEFRREESSRRSRYPSPLHEACDAYIVKRGSGKTIIAGYPWFADWGRDTFISIRGACLSAKRFDCAAEIFTTWLDTLSDGMIPNRFPDVGNDVEYNSVDASLWFVVAAGEFITLTPRKYKQLKDRLVEAILNIVSAYQAGTRYSIGAGEDGLLKAGMKGTQITWMDARCDGITFTPRVGKPVEIQALWYNALLIAARIEKKWLNVAKSVALVFEEKFWNPKIGILYDVVDVNHEEGINDSAFRPNQLYAIGGLPYQLLQGEKAQAVVEACHRDLLTPFGLRTLDPTDVNFSARYEGNNFKRDSSYHQGTVWPWLMGTFVDAWLRVNGDTKENRIYAKEIFLNDLLSLIYSSESSHHIREIYDATSPFEGRGAPFQAWSVSELLRLVYSVLVP